MSKTTKRSGARWMWNMAHGFVSPWTHPRRTWRASTGAGYRASRQKVFILSSLAVLSAMLAPSAMAVQSSRGEAQSPRTTVTKDPASALRELLLSLPRPTKLGRIRSVRVQSTVTFKGAENRPHNLATSFGFPARTRFELSNGSGGQRERYQLGTTVFAREVRPSRGPETRVSVHLDGERKRETELDLSLIHI